jgi:hypothetical protein
MRVVIGAVSHVNGGNAAKVKLECCLRGRRKLAGARATSFDGCLGPEWEFPAPHGRQRWTSLFSDPAFAPALPKKPDPSLL